MDRDRVYVRLGLVVGLLVLPLVAEATDQMVLGNTFTVLSSPIGTKRKIVVAGKEIASDDTIVGDPLGYGAILTITASGDASFTQTYTLPAGVSAVTGRTFWRGDAVHGFNYGDTRGENGPVTKLQMKLTGGVFQIKAAVDGRLGAITVIPPNPGTSACALLRLGRGDSYSVRFADGRMTNRGNQLFKVTLPTSEGSCIGAAGPKTPVAFQDPVPVLGGGAGIQLPVKAVPRLVDWNGDGALDLLVFAGDGTVSLSMASGPQTSTSFQSPSKLKDAGGNENRVGTSYTGGAFVDLNGDGKRDLVVAGIDGRVWLFANINTSTAPVLSASPVALQTGSGDLVLPAGCQSRIDVADWNGDGLVDILAGDHDGGTVTFYRNTGMAKAPAFAAPGVGLSVNGIPIGEPYNTHPRAFDLNADGVLDLAYGINWHYFRLCPRDSSAATDLLSCSYAANLAGAPFNIRLDQWDDSCPDFADLNGDGVLDMVDGGLAGRVVVLYGRPASDVLDRVDTIMAAHLGDLGPTLARDIPLRAELFGLHHQLRAFVAQMKPDLETRTAIRDWYVAHIAQYPQYLPWQHLDKEAQAFVPLLAGQCWINLLESMPDTSEHRALVANACGFSGVERELLVNAGMVFIENGSSSLSQKSVLRDLQLSLPAPYRVVEAVSIGGWLYPTGIPNPPGMTARTGINIYSDQVGATAEGFPPDVPQTLIDTYAVAAAHELNHNVEAPAATLFPTWYRQRKSQLLKEAAPADYRWIANADGTWSWDLAATRQVFQTKGYWDGDDAHWASAVDAYWSSGPGAGYDRHWCRDNLRYSIENPGEAFATLANQYFDSSEVMLQLGLTRYANGNPWCLDEVLWFAEVYAVGGSTTSFYRVDEQGTVTRSDVAIHRGPGGHIDGLTLPNGTHHGFTIAANGDVLAVGP